MSNLAAMGRRHHQVAYQQAVGHAIGLLIQFGYQETYDALNVCPKCARVVTAHLRQQLETLHKEAENE